MNILSLTIPHPHFGSLDRFFDSLQGMELLDKVVLLIAHEDATEFENIANTIPTNIEVRNCLDLGPVKNLFLP
jgi:hypothetical protein